MRPIHPPRLPVAISSAPALPNHRCDDSPLVKRRALTRSCLRTAEPGYATLKTDQSVWNKHANAQGKGYSFGKIQRFARPPGPGSNRPLEKLTPGPGSYGRLHSWPKEGFRGGARGYNHNAAVG